MAMFETWKFFFPMHLTSFVPVLLAASMVSFAPDSHAALAGLWRFNGAGGTQADSSGNSNAATTMNGAVWAFDATRNSGTMSFDGINDFLEAADSASLSITGDMSITAWINMTTLASGGQYRGVLAKDPTGSGNPAPYQLWFNQGNNLAGFGRGNGALSDFAFGSTGLGNVPVAGAWEHWAVSHTGTAVTIYRNGLTIAMADALINTTIADGNGTLIIGDRPGMQDMSFHGRMDDVAIFNQALTQAEVQTIMGGDFSAFGVPVPEPGTATVGLAALGVAFLRRRRK